MPALQIVVSWPDLVNGLFELIGGLLICLSIRRLHIDKEVKGVSALPTAFFTSWGYWNLFYYPSLSQWASFVGGCVIVAANTAWVLQMLYYSARVRRRPWRR